MTATGRQQYVYVLRGTEAEAVPVTTGYTDGVATEIRKGNVEVGTKVVTEVIDPAVMKNLPRKTSLTAAVFAGFKEWARASRPGAPARHAAGNERWGAEHESS